MTYMGIICAKCGNSWSGCEGDIKEWKCPICNFGELMSYTGGENKE